jgi:hypothetical protein
MNDDIKAIQYVDSMIAHIIGLNRMVGSNKPVTKADEAKRAFELRRVFGYGIAVRYLRKRNWSLNAAHILLGAEHE